MTLIDGLFIAVLGLICGSVGQLTSGYTSGGWAVHLGLGWIGAAVGTYLSRAFHAPLVYNITVDKTEFPVIWALVGSVFFVAAIGFFIKPSRQ